MVGSLGGSEEKVKVEPFDTLVDTGKRESFEAGTVALIYLVKSMKNLPIH